MILGKETKSRHKLALFFAGRVEDKNYFVKSVFGNYYNEQHIGKIWLWRISHVVKKRKINSSLIVTEVYNLLSFFYNKRKCFCIPRWISSEVDISKNFTSFSKKPSFKADLRSIKRNKLKIEITKNQSLLYYFYHNMYTPYIKKVHGNTAILNQYEYVKERFNNCELYLLKKEKIYIAGVLVVYSEKDKSRLWILGIKDGSRNYVIKDRAIGALNYLTILHLKEKGIKKVNLGSSRSFFNDGVLQSKKKWNAALTGRSESCFLIKPFSREEGVKSFLLNNPFIFYKKRQLNGAVFVENNKAISMEQFKKIYKNYFSSGMHKIYIYRLRGSDCWETKEFVPPEFCDKVTLSSLENYFK
jgi:hypothetical protein